MTQSAFDQLEFRGRDDDVTLNSATFNGGGGLNTNWTQDADTNFRIRFTVGETAGGMGPNKTFTLFFSHNAAAYAEMTTTTLLRPAATNQYANGDTTTQVIGDGTYVAGESLGGVDNAEDTGNIDFDGNDEAEVEFCLTINGAQVSDSDTIAIRVYESNGTQFGNYASTPTITVNKPLALTAETGTLTLTGNAANLKRSLIMTAATGTLTVKGWGPTLLYSNASNTTASISQSSDDAEEQDSSGTMNLTSIDIDINNHDTDGSYWAAFRFNVTIPTGATINAAYIEAEAVETLTLSDTLTIRAEDIDDAPTFTTTTSDISNRTLTTAGVDWIPGTWTDGVLHRTPDLSTIVQEVSDRAGRSATFNLAIIIPPGAGTDRVQANSFDGGAPAPSIRIEYTEASSTYTLTAATGTLTLTGNAANLNRALVLTAAVGTLTLTGNAANLNRALVMSAATGSLTLTGNAVGLNVTYNLTAAAGSLTLTGNAATLTRALIMVADSGTLTLTGNVANLNRSLVMAAAAGSLTLTGNAANFRLGVTMVAAAGSLTLTGNAATLTRSLIMVASAGSLTLTGNAAALTLDTLTLVAEAGSLTLTGNAAGLLRSLVLTAEAGSFTLTGNAVTLSVGTIIVADAGTLTLTGNAAGLTVGRAITAEAGSLALTGNAATLTRALIMVAAAGSLTLTGQDAGLAVGRALAADAGSLSLTGNDAAITAALIMAAASGSLTLTGNAAGLNYSAEVKQIYTTALSANLTPTISLNANISPSATLETQPTPAEEVEIG